MKMLGGLALIDEVGLKLKWISDDVPIPIEKGHTDGIDPWVYSGSLIATSGQQITLTLTDGSQETITVNTRPPATWDGQSMRLSARLAQLRSQGVLIEGMQGHAEWAARRNPFASPLPLIPTDQRVADALDRIESGQAELLTLVRQLSVPTGTGT